MTKQTDTPMHRIIMVKGKLEAMQDHPQVKDMYDIDEVLAEANFAITMLMDIRNSMASMVGLKQEPKEAIKNVFGE